MLTRICRFLANVLVLWLLAYTVLAVGVLAVAGLVHLLARSEGMLRTGPWLWPVFVVSLAIALVRELEGRPRWLARLTRRIRWDEDKWNARWGGR
jgi:hypothetical protein